jgi:YidC/Oxa1 family membrane protein insertase
VYLAQSGLIGAASEPGFPNHRTPMMPLDGNAARVLADGSDAVQLSLSAESGGVRLVRTYTLARGAYVVDVKDEITNVGAAPARPVLYMQLTRDGNSPPGESSSTARHRRWSTPTPTNSRRSGSAHRQGRRQALGSADSS